MTLWTILSHPCFAWWWWWWWWSKGSALWVCDMCNLVNPCPLEMNGFTVIVESFKGLTCYFLDYNAEECIGHTLHSTLHPPGKSNKVWILTANVNLRLLIIFLSKLVSFLVLLYWFCFLDYSVQNGTFFIKFNHSSFMDYKLFMFYFSMFTTQTLEHY